MVISPPPTREAVIVGKCSPLRKCIHAPSFSLCALHPKCLLFPCDTRAQGLKKPHVFASPCMTSNRNHLRRSISSRISCTILLVAESRGLPQLTIASRRLCIPVDDQVTWRARQATHYL